MQAWLQHIIFWKQAVRLQSPYWKHEALVPGRLEGMVRGHFAWISQRPCINEILGGHLRPDLYGHIPTYIKRFGVQTAAELAEFEIAHVKAIKRVVEKEKIDCDFTITRTTDVWANQEAAEKAKDVYDMMVAHGLEYMNDVSFTMGKDAPGVCAI